MAHTDSPKPGVTDVEYQENSKENSDSMNLGGQIMVGEQEQTRIRRKVSSKRSFYHLED